MREKVLLLERQLQEKNTSKREEVKVSLLKDVNLFDVESNRVSKLPDLESDKNKKLSVELFGESSDEEVEKYPLEDRGLNEFGKFVKQRLSHAANKEDKRNTGLPNERKSKSTQIKNPTNNKSKQASIIETEFFSGIKIINPLVPSSVMKEKMEGRRLIRMSVIHNFLRGGEIEGDWVTIGVIIAKTDPKVSSKGKTFSIWRMSDLRDCSKVISFFLFGKVHQTHWKNTVGTVVGILNPASMGARESTSSKYASDISFTIDHQDKIMILGTSRDFGHCRSRKKDGGQCMMVVNISVCEYCPFHIQAAYKKSSGKRTELQSSYSGGQPVGIKRKILQNQQIFYGGQTFTSPALKSNKPTKKTLTLESFKLQRQAKNLEVDFKNKVDLPSNGVISDSFGDLMSIPSIGSRNLIKHLTKSEKKKPEFKSISASELIKMHKKELTQTTFNRPVIGAGLAAGQIINLSLTPKRTTFMNRNEIAKLKATEKIRSNGIIEKIDPNAVKKVQTAETIEKTIKRVENDIKETCQVQETKRQRLNNDEFQRILNAKSLHADSVTEEELEQQEKYFNQMEHKEKLESKMCSIQEMQCKAVSCKKCKYTALSISARCKQEQHPLVYHKATKRFFKCTNCNQRTISFNKIPTKQCTKCGEMNYERCGMKEERNGRKLDSEQLSIRGDEVTFLNSFSTNGLNINL